jgi:hypothetical protein
MNIYAKAGLAALATLTVAVAVHAAPEDSAQRRRCYIDGVIHGEDETDPTIIGIPEGTACRESYSAGRQFFRRCLKQSDDAMAFFLRNTLKDE